MKAIAVICILLQTILASRLSAYLTYLGFGMDTEQHWILWGFYTAMTLVTLIGGILIYALYSVKRD
jgi:hypothetical protein